LLLAPALREIRIFKGLVLFAAVDLGAPTSQEVFCPNASEAGLGLRVVRIPEDGVRALARCRERWRFVPEEKRPVLDSGTCTPGCSPSAAPWAGRAAGLIPGRPRCGILFRDAERPGPGSTSRTPSST